MSHPSHRDHLNAVKAKRIWTDLKDDEASRIEALLSAAQQQDREKPVYRELVKPVEMQGRQA